MYKAIQRIPIPILNKYGSSITEYTYNTMSSVDRNYYIKEVEETVDYRTEILNPNVSS